MGQFHDYQPFGEGPEEPQEGGRGGLEAAKATPTSSKFLKDLERDLLSFPGSSWEVSSRAGVAASVPWALFLSSPAELRVLPPAE